MVAMATARAEEVATAEEAGGEAAATSGDGTGKSKRKKNHPRTPKNKRKAGDHDGNACNDTESSTRRRHFRSRLDMSLFTYPGFFWVDHIPPQAGAEMSTS